MQLSEDKIAYLRKVLKPYKLRSPSPGCSDAGKRNSPEQDSYFNYLIRDVLSQIRHGKTDYVFTEPQIIELLRYEPNVKIKWSSEDNCYMVYM